MLGILLAGLPLLVATSAEAAKPAHRACLGQDFAFLATFGAKFLGYKNPGQLIVTFEEPDGTRTIEGGLGSAIQAWLAGNVPEAELPNSCND